MKVPRFHRRFGYDLGLLPNQRLRDLELGVDSLDQARQRTGASIGYPGWGVIYHLLLSHLDPEEPNLIVETGTNLGCSTIILAQALRDTGDRGRVLTFELDSGNARAARQNLENASLEDLVEIIEGDTRETLPPRLADAENIRVAFLDGSHLYEHVLFEFATILPKLQPTSLVLFDNTYAIAEPEKGEDLRVHGALHRILADHGGHLINLEFVSWFTPGLAIWQRRPFPSC